MKRSLYLSVFFLVFSPSIFAQKKIEGHWGKKYLDVAYAAAATDDGGYIITGLTLNGLNDPNGDIVVIKTNTVGDTMWTLLYGGPNLEGGNGVIQTADGGYMVSGHTEDFGARDCDAFLMKLDRQGNHEWFKVYGGDDDDIAYSALQLADGGYIFTGTTASYGNPPSNTESRHAYFVRTNSTGDTTWTKYYAGTGAEEAYSIASMPGGGFLAAGWSTSYGNGESDGWLLRLKDNGDTLWTRLYKNEGDCRYFRVIPTIDHGYMVAGYTTPGKTASPQGLMIKLDAAGGELWRKTFGGANDGIVFHDVAQLPNGNFICTGSNSSVDTTGNLYIMTTDANGIMLTDDLHTESNSYANAIAIQGNNSYLVAGASAQYGDSDGDLYYMEVDNTISGIPGISVSLPRLFPNPVKDMSCVILPEVEAYQSCSIAVMSADGKLIYRQNNIMAKDLVIYRNTLPAGTYLFRVACKNGNVYKGKFAAE